MDRLLRFCIQIRTEADLNCNCVSFFVCPGAVPELACRRDCSTRFSSFRLRTSVDSWATESSPWM